jgi:hypothetical protein
MAYSFHKQFVLLKAIDAADFVTAKYRADVKASQEAMPTPRSSAPSPAFGRTRRALPRDTELVAPRTRTAQQFVSKPLQILVSGSSG